MKIAYINEDGYRFNIIGNYFFTGFGGFGDMGMMGGMQVENQSKKAPSQTGNSWVDTRIDSRIMDIEFTILGKKREDIENRRRTVTRVFSGELGLGRLEASLGSGSVFEIACKPIEILFYKGERQGPTFQDVMVQFEAPFPYWYKAQEKQFEFVGYEGGLTVPFQFPWTFGTTGTKTTVRNNGMVKFTPVKLLLYGEVVEPTITNHTINQSIEVVTTVGAEEVLMIDTGIERKRVEIDGENAFQFVNPLSDFWGLLRGDNVIEYSSVSQSAEAKCVLIFREYFVGL